MSSDTFKFLHSRRMLHTKNAINRQTNIAKLHGIDEEETHRYAKHRAMNCGQSKCVICANPRKLFGEKTIQERSVEQLRIHDEYDFEYYQE